MVKEGMTKIYERPSILTDNRMHYCPGCGHSIVHKLLAEIIEELDIQDKTVGVCPVGCSVFAYNYIDIDWHEAAHGRACAVATGVKRVLPDRYVFTYQGDGDLAAIGTAETIHASNRGENMMIIFINNAIYGMTGGQMAPTTMPDQVTSTSPYGRDTKDVGFPIKIADIVSMLPGTYYVTRQSICTPGNVRKLKKALIKGFKNQDLNKGTSFIELFQTALQDGKQLQFRAYNGSKIICCHILN